MKKTFALMQRQVHQGQPHYRPRPRPATGVQQSPPPFSGQRQQALPTQGEMRSDGEANSSLVVSETRLEGAVRNLRESRKRLEEHSAEIEVVRSRQLCSRDSLSENQRLRLKVAQCWRDVIWARDRIRFGRD